MLAPRPTPKLEDHPSSAVRGCLFNLFIATLHIGGRSSIRKLRTRHSVVTGTDGFRIVLQGEHILLITLPVLVTNCKGLELMSSADDCTDVQDASVCYAMERVMRCNLIITLLLIIVMLSFAFGHQTDCNSLFTSTFLKIGICV